MSSPTGSSSFDLSHQVGERNGVIAQFNSLNSRNDVGQLWENFVFIERLKKQAYSRFYGNRYFWRTYSGQEIDFLEEIDGALYPFEAKWAKKEVKTPLLWKNQYPHYPLEVITPGNYLTHTT